MKSFKEHLAESKKNYSYTIKLAINEFSAADEIKKELEKHNIITFSDFKRSPIQANPLDFPNVKNTEVHIADFTCEYPCTSDMLENQIANLLRVPRTFVIVYTENDPRKQNTEDFLTRTNPQYKDNYDPVLTSEYKDIPGEKIDQIKSALDKIERIKTKTVTNTLIPDQKIEKADTTEMPAQNNKSVIGS